MTVQHACPSESRISEIAAEKSQSTAAVAPVQQPARVKSATASDARDDAPKEGKRKASSASDEDSFSDGDSSSEDDVNDFDSDQDDGGDQQGHSSKRQRQN